jgi:hypothetical protein
LSSEVAFTAIYAAVMTGAAFGLDRVGRAGARRRLSASAPELATVDDMPWPELGSMALHTVIAAVAVVASLGLVAVMLIRHHDVADVATLAVPALLGVAAFRGLVGGERLRGWLACVGHIPR